MLIVEWNSPTDMDLAIGIAAAVVAGVLVYMALSKFLDRKSVGGDAQPTAEQRFRNVYAIMDEGRRQSLIRYYMEKHECSREEAMRHAVEDRERDINRW